MRGANDASVTGWSTRLRRRLTHPDAIHAVADRRP